MRAFGYLGLDGWAGISWTKVRIVGETAHKLRITPVDDKRVKLGGRSRWLEPGDTALVPKHAVRLHDDADSTCDRESE